MTTCPNCGRPVNDADKVCPECHFNLQKYRDAFLTEQPHENSGETKDERTAKIASREDYCQEFYPKKQNLVIQKMLQWIHVNSMIVFLLGIALLIIMSFSRSIGWICFFALIVWLYAVCVRTAKIDRYTVDERLTEKVNQVGSDLFNNVADSKQKVKAKKRSTDRKQGGDELAATPVKKHFNYPQLLVILLAVINLIVLFTGSGASVSDFTYSGKMSITRVAFGLAGRLFASSTTLISGIVVCVLWLLIVLFPIFIIYHTLKDTVKSRRIAFALSLIESLFLIYLIYLMSNSQLSGTGLLKNITTELLIYAVSVGTSTYFVVLSSIMMTILSGYNLLRKKQPEQ